MDDYLSDDSDVDTNYSDDPEVDLADLNDSYSSDMDEL